MAIVRTFLMICKKVRLRVLYALMPFLRKLLKLKRFLHEFVQDINIYIYKQLVVPKLHFGGERK